MTAHPSPIAECGVRLLTAAQVAELLQCTVQTVEIAARDGRLPGVQYGRAWLFPEDALIEALRVQALANLRAAPERAPAPVLPDAAHAFTAPPGRRKAANSGRTRLRPELPRLIG
ncbi:helix-turn-helix domain-containing protein [Variovorax sp. RCC_210]|uniref:helix-turn-helix domain-containing protein n=1 Tax=Variovorax sp. RCC_210 TaxID=3239217 RepID=UPI0035261BB2